MEQKGTWINWFFCKFVFFVLFKRAKKDSEKYKFFFRRRFVYALPEVSRVIDIESLNSKHYTHEGNASERER